MTYVSFLASVVYIQVLTLLNTETTNPNVVIYIIPPNLSPSLQSERPVNCSGYAVLVYVSRGARRIPSQQAPVFPRKGSHEVHNGNLMD